MIPTPRLLFCILVGAAIIAISGNTQAGYYVVCFYSLVLLFFIAADAYALPTTDVVEVERINDSKLSLGAPNVITLFVVNRTRHTLSFRIRDEFPYQFSTNIAFLSGSIGPMDICELQYTVEPKQRGAYLFGDITIRYRSPRRLLLKQIRYAATAEIRVYPNLLSIQQYDIMTRRGLVQEAGLRKSRSTSSSTEFERLRDYQADDEFRHINWQATARRGKPIAATYETERSQFVVSMIDTGRLMRPAINGIAKLDHIINTVLLLSYVTTLKGDYVGLITFADDVGAHIKPKKGKVQFHTIIEALYKITSHAVESDYARAIPYLALHHKRRSLIVIFTDLTTLDAAQTLITYASRIAQRHLVLCVTISDPSVHAIASQRVYTSNTLYTRAVAESLSNERQTILETLNRHGILTIDVPAHQLTTQVIQTYLQLKERGTL